MIINDIREWMKATYVSSMEFCGEEISPHYMSWDLPLHQKQNKKCTEWLYFKKPRLFCMDGFNMSLQGGYGMYSTPKYNSMYYSEMEIGFPSESIPECSIDDVGGYISVDALQRIIDEHGGIDFDKSLSGLNFSNANKYKRYKKLERIINNENLSM